MITVRKSKDRGHADHGWLETRHTFSFASYLDPEHMKFHALRVINEDWIQAGKGFGTHPHENMEIITYIISGALEHKDSMGNGSVIRPGELQRLTAGTGITHSEFNPSDKEDTHLLQIWIYPEETGLTPGYEQRDFSALELPNQLTLLASRTGRNQSLTVHQDVDLYCGLLEQEKELKYYLPPERHIWLQVVKGVVAANNTVLHAGDGCVISDENAVQLAADTNSEFLLFDLA
ncbi:MAG: pirin family protein [Kiritimatiellales bacterium]|nr:pirin family protein [Kiritimatiellales bacterium]